MVGAAPWPMTATGGFAAASEPMLDHPVRGGTYILIRKVKPLLIRNVCIVADTSIICHRQVKQGGRSTQIIGNNDEIY